MPAWTCDVLFGLGSGVIDGESWLLGSSSHASVSSLISRWYLVL